MKLRTKSHLLLAAAALLLPLALGVTLLTARDVEAQQHDMIRTEALIDNIEQLRLIAIETVLFHETRSSQQWQRQVAVMHDELARYADVSKDSPAQQAATVHLHGKLETAQVVYARLATITATGTPVALDDSGLAARSVASLLVITAEMTEVGHELSTQSRANVEQALLRLQLAITALVLAMAVLMALVWRLMRHSVLRPLDQLEQGTRRVAAGDYSQRLNLPQRDELGHLADAFDTMTAQVQQALQLQQALNHSLLLSTAAQQQGASALAAESLALENIITGTDVGTWEWNIETGVVRLSPRWAQMIGHTPDELQPTTISAWSALIHPDERSDSAAQLERHLDGRSPAYERESRVRHKDGHWVWVLDRAKLLGRSDDDGRPRWLVGTRMDISERKRAEAEVQRSAALLRGAIEAVDEAFVLYDPDDRLVVCNDRYRQTYPNMAHLMVPGNTFEQIVRAGAENGDYADAVGRVEEWVAERLAAHRSGNTTLVQKLSSGRTLRIIERKMPDGHIVGFRIDITELVLATEAAQAASTSKSQFLANMSHEIRTPMNAILGMLALLRKTALDARQADYAGKTEGAARSLLRLLNDILDFSKVEAGKMTLDAHPFRIDRLLRDLSDIVSANVGAKPVELLFDIDPTLPRHLVGDAMRLQQVLINLSGNAVKFTEQGEVVLSMKVLALDSARVTLEVALRDTGIGIAPENQARIFSGFTQAEASITRRFGGTGLGVAISQRLVQLMGGELQLQSALGQGSRFHFQLTLALAAEAADDRADDGQAVARPALATPLRALVIDDNASARAVIERMGQALGWTVDLADSGARALALLQAQATAGITCDAVFVDWQMPGLDGWQTSQRIRQLGLTGEAPVVVMVTAHGRERLARHSAAKQALIDGFLVKPFTASMLLDAVVDARLGHDRPHPSRSVATPAGQRLAGLRLLVVEDNLNNQQVARELLEDEGASVQIAHHGQEGVAAVAAADPPFDLVLMDLQMPVMDGFTAAARIRQDLGQRTLPIIAMTANVMASDREACLAAGMNDHVGKPFDLDHLVGVLRRHAGRHAQLALPAAAPGSSTSPATRSATAMVAATLPGDMTDAAAAAGVDLRAALNRLGGKRAIYQRLLRNFVVDLAAMPALLQAHLAAGEALAAAQLMHTLKGLAATLGATTLSAQAAAAERAFGGPLQPAAAEATTQQISLQMQTALSLLSSLHQALDDQQTLADAAAEPATPASETAAAAAAENPLALAAGLTTLAGLLADSDMAAVDLLDRLRAGPGVQLGARFGPLDDAVERLDFQQAATACLNLLKALSPS